MVQSQSSGTELKKSTVVYVETFKVEVHILSCTSKYASLDIRFLILLLVWVTI